ARGGGTGDAQLCRAARDRPGLRSARRALRGRLIVRDGRGAARAPRRVLHVDARARAPAAWGGIRKPDQSPPDRRRHLGPAVLDRGPPRPRPADVPRSTFRVVYPGYFATMRLPLLRGRDVAETDRADAPRVVV